MSPIDISKIMEAENRLRRFAPVTPLLESRLVNEQLGGRLLIKAECLQRTGSFKFRGAINRISKIPEQERARGVVAYSSGNHAQGVAEAAHLFGIKARIVMPLSAPSIKKANTRALGAEVIEYDIETESREEIGQRISAETGATLVKPYDDPLVIAGQGTTGLEMSRQLNERDIQIDQLLIPCGGGGLCAGTSIAVHDAFPECRIMAVEPKEFDDTRRSLEAGSRLSNELSQGTLCDSIITPTPGEITFPINQAHLDGAVTVTDDEVMSAMRTAFLRYKIVVEPGGAVALAAVLSGKVTVAEKTTVVVCSGGNVDEELFKRCLNTG